MKLAFRLLAPIGLLVAPASAPAEVFRDIAFGLGYVGFDIAGSHNPLSGGTDFLVTNTFQGNELDFGAGDLTLAGPISLSLSGGGRELSELEFSLRTAPNATAAASPLAYSLNYDTGAQAVNVSGTLFMDANVTINEFGFYDLEVQYSSRQTVTQDGRIENSSTDYDFDAGPINVRGNIFADALALITEPLFAAAGTTNPFAEFSASANLKALLEQQAQAAASDLAAGTTSADAEIARAANQAVIEQILGSTLSGLLAEGASPAAGARLATATVPEPTVLLLMLLGVPVVIHHAFRRTRSKSS